MENMVLVLKGTGDNETSLDLENRIDALRTKLRNQNTVDVDEGVYSFEDNSFDGTMAWSSGGGISAGFDDVKKLAHSQRSRQMWLGFGAFALLGIVGVSLLRKKY